MKKLGCTMCILAFPSFSAEISELRMQKLGCTMLILGPASCVLLGWLGLLPGCLEFPPVGWSLFLAGWSLFLAGWTLFLASWSFSWLATLRGNCCARTTGVPEGAPCRWFNHMEVMSAYAQQVRQKPSKERCQRPWQVILCLTSARS